MNVENDVVTSGIKKKKNNKYDGWEVLRPLARKLKEIVLKKKYPGNGSKDLVETYYTGSGLSALLFWMLPTLMFHFQRSVHSYVYLLLARIKLVAQNFQK